VCLTFGFLRKNWAKKGNKMKKENNGDKYYAPSEGSGRKNR
jgi:hypothetical protein